jgi:pimeloyl-ACP methyl ester carboxylesterase
MYVTLPDVRLFFDVEGAQLVPDGVAMRERPTIICLHGGPGLDHSTLKTPFAPLSEVAQVIFLDQRGHGRSDRSVPRRWTLAQWAQDLRDFIDALGIVRPIVLGVSFGGYVAMTYAIRYPEHPGKLILISTSARGTDHPEREARVLEAFERRGGPTASATALRAFNERTPESYAEYVRVCMPLYHRNGADPDSAARTIANDVLVPYFEREGGEGAVFDLRSELAAIRCPTLLIGGEDDPITPISEQQTIADAIPPGLARVVSFPGCGHGVWRGDPEGLRQTIAAFACTLCQ